MNVGKVVYLILEGGSGVEQVSFFFAIAEKKKGFVGKERVKVTLPLIFTESLSRGAGQHTGGKSHFHRDDS